MKISVHHRRSATTVRREQPGATVLDLTSRAPAPWVRFSPFFPHNDIPVPGAPGRVCASVEGLWQALKVFSRADVDEKKLSITSMRGLKRSASSFGPVLGHRAGLGSERVLNYVAARRQIYLPAYRHVLLHHLTAELAELARLADTPGGLVLLDFETNVDVDDASRPLSHAGLVMHHLRGTWPADP